MMASRFTLKKILFVALLCLGVVLHLQVPVANGMATVLQLVSVSVQSVQNVVVLLSTAIYSAVNYKQDSLVGRAIAQSVKQESLPASPATAHDVLATMHQLETIRQDVVTCQHQPTINTYILPQIKLFDHAQQSRAAAQRYNLLNKIATNSAAAPQAHERSVPVIKQLSLEEIRRIALATIGTSSVSAITKQIEQRMALQSRLGLMNFKGIVLAAGESRDGHMTCYLGLKERSSREINADIQTAKWKFRQEILHLLATDIDYRNHVYRQYKSAINWMLDANHPSSIKRIRARLMLPALMFEGNNWEEFYHAAYEIETYLFARDGALTPLKRINAIPKAVTALLKTVEKTWPTIIEGVDAQRARLLKKGEVDNPWALWFAPGMLEFSARIIKNPENRLLLQVLDACEQGNIGLAENLYRQAQRSGMHNAVCLAQELLQEARSLFCDQYGIYRVAQADPLYQQLTDHDKAFLATNAAERAAINETFLLRRNLKTTFEQAWQIPQNAPPPVHQAIYKLLDDNALALANVPLLIDKLIELTADYSNPHHHELLSAFFLPNGVLKDFAHYERTKSLVLPPAIAQAENVFLRRVLNNALYIEHALPGTQQAAVAGKILECIVKRFATSEPRIVKQYDDVIAHAYTKLIDQRTSLKEVLVALQDALAGGHALGSGSTSYMPMPDPNDPEHKKRTQEHLAILEESQELKALEKRVKELWDALDDKQVRSKMPNNMDVNDFPKIEAKAKLLYDQISNMTTDVEKIANNTGIPTKIIKAIKNHVFYDNHFLSEGVMKFHPDIDMLEAWTRLINGTFFRADLMFILHEFAESLVMRGTEVSYMEAHPLVERLYNWNQLILR